VQALRRAHGGRIAYALQHAVAERPLEALVNNAALALALNCTASMTSRSPAVRLDELPAEVCAEVLCAGHDQAALRLPRC